MSARGRMREHHWGALDNFDWSYRAREEWSKLRDGDRLAVFNAAKAEIAASVAYNRASARIEKALDPSPECGCNCCQACARTQGARGAGGAVPADAVRSDRARRRCRVHAPGHAPAAAIDHPSHYTSHPSGVECITITEHHNFNVGNAIKYLWRAGLKGAATEDLKKARWYIDREIARMTKGGAA